MDSMPSCDHTKAPRISLKPVQTHALVVDGERFPFLEWCEGCGCLVTGNPPRVVLEPRRTSPYPLEAALHRALPSFERVLFNDSGVPRHFEAKD